MNQPQPRKKNFIQVIMANRSLRIPAILFSILLLAGIGGAAYFLLGSNKVKVNGSFIGATAANVERIPDAVPTQEQVSQIKSRNDHRLDVALQSDTPMHIDQTFNTTDFVAGQEIEYCDCQIKDEQFLAQLNRLVDLGSMSIRKKQVAKLFGNSGFGAATDGTLVTSDGNAVIIDGKEVVVGPDGIVRSKTGEVILGDDGQPLRMNSNGQFIDSSGRVVDLSNRTSYTGDEIEPFTKLGGDLGFRSDGTVVGPDGKPLLFDGEEFSIGPGGILIGKDGEPILDESGQPLIMGDNGQLLRSDGSVYDPKGRMTTSDNTVITKDGKVVDPSSMVQIGASDLFLVPGNPALIVTKNGKGVLHLGLPVFLSQESQVLNEEGKGIKYKKRDVLINALGALVDNKENPHIDDGILVTADGYMISATGFVIRPLGAGAERMGNTDIYIDDSNFLVDKAGKPIKHLGQAVSWSDNDTLVTALGPVVSRTGQDVYMMARDGRILVGDRPINHSSFLQTESGVAFTEFGRTLQSGDINPIGQSDIYFRLIDGLVTDSAGKPMTSDEQPVFQNRKAILNNELVPLQKYFGQPVVNENGQPVYLNKKGQLVNRAGEVVSTGTLKTQDGSAVTGEGKSLGATGKMALRSTNGTAVFTRDGRAVYKGENGQLIYADGSPVLSESGEAMFVDSAGNVINEDSELVSETGLIDVDDVTLRKDGKRQLFGGGTLVNALGEEREITLPNGSKAKLRVLLDNDGNPVTDADGNPILVDPKTGKVYTSGGALLDQSGKPFTVNGKAVKKGPNGELLYLDGSPVIGDDGKPLKVLVDGTIVDGSGKVVAKGLTSALNEVDDLDSIPDINSLVDLRKVSESGIADGLSQLGNGAIFESEDGLLLDSSGKPLMVDGKPVRRNSDGTLSFLDGSPVLGPDGRPVSMNNDGQLISSTGQPIEEGLFTTADGVAINADGTVASDPIRIGVSDLFRTKDGRLVDSNGRVFTDLEENQVTLNDRGMIATIDGKPVTDSKGRRVYVNENGELVYKDGSPVANDAALLSSDGRAVMKDGTVIDPRSLTAIEGTPYFQDQNGLIVDKDGKPILIDGEPAYVSSLGQRDSNGRIKMTLNGRKQVSIDEDGVISTGDGSSPELGGRTVVTSNVDASKLGLPSNGVATLIPDAPDLETKPQAATSGTQGSVGFKPVETVVTDGFVQPGQSEGGTKGSNGGADPLADRYTTLKGLLQTKLAQVDLNIQEAHKGEAKGIDVGGTTETMHPTQEELAQALEGELLSGEGVEDGPIVLVERYDVIYGVFSTQLDSDASPEVRITLMGDGLLDGAKTVGTFTTNELLGTTYMTTSSVELNDGNSAVLNATVTSYDDLSPALDVDIDQRLLLRYGSLAGASFMEGVGKGNAAMASTTSTLDPTTGLPVTQSSGIGTAGLLLNAAGNTGSGLAPEVAKYSALPVRATAPKGRRVALILNEDLIVE